MKKKNFINYCGLLGVAEFISYTAAVVFSPLAYPGYNWMAQAVSDLSASNAPSLRLWNQLSSLYNVCTLVCAMMVCLGIQKKEEQLKESQEIKTETGVVLSWKYLCWVREQPVKSICKETNILYGTQDEMIPYKIVKRFSEENNCRLNFVENGQHWLHTDREVAAMRKWEQTVLEESRSIIPNK